MKKLSIIALAALLVIAFTLPASAVENIFGGYWRTRMFSQMDFTGDDSEDQDLSVVDTRTRLYYTAKFSDNLKLVNKFEMDAVWGSNTTNAAGDSGYGDIGADGIRVEVKNSYADFNLGEMVNAKVGVQDYVIAKGFVFDDDGAGVRLNFKAGMADIPIWWIKFNEGGMGEGANDYDWDGFAIYPSIKVADGMTIKPHVFYLYANKSLLVDADGVVLDDDVETSIYTVGLEFDGKVGPAAFGLTGIYQGGTIDYSVGTDSDISAYLAAVTAGMDFGPVNVHGEFMYASGDEDADDDIESFVIIPGVSHYWAEIMGYGLFDNQTSNGAPANKISNLLAGNVGVSAKVMEKVKLSFDVWYAMLAEENAVGDDELGTELDFRATIPVVDKLNLDLVAAYLFAGDVTGDEDPIELGAQLSLAF